jgi:hypothetical protein
MYVLNFYLPTFAHIVGLSAVFFGLTPLVSALPLDYSFTVGACLFLLSMVVLFPLAMRANSGARRFPGAPFVYLNFAYFVAATVVPLAYPQLEVPVISFESIPLALLILCLGFLFFDLAIIVSGRIPRSRSSPSSSVKRVRGLGWVFAAVTALLWGLRLFLAANGWGITHASYLLSLNWEVRQLVALSNAVAFVPLCLCLARLACAGSSKTELYQWQKRAMWVMATDMAYYLWAGGRLSFLWEALIVFWCIWLRLIPPFPRRKALLLGIALAVAMPIVYAERNALRYLSPQAGENQVALTRASLLQEQAQVVHDSLLESLKEGIYADSGRLTAIAPFSAVVDGVSNHDFPPMWGETWGEELPLLIPRLFWPAKPIPRNIDEVINRHFNLPGVDVLTTCQTEFVANFGIWGLCAWMLFFGVLTERVLGWLGRNARTSEPVTFCVLYAIPALFLVETDTTSMLAGLRILPAIWVVLTALAVRRLPAQT